MENKIPIGERLQKKYVEGLGWYALCKWDNK